MAIQKELIQALAQSDAFAEMLENRMKGFWNTDYFKKIVLPQLDFKAGDKVLDVGAGNTGFSSHTNGKSAFADNHRAEKIRGS